MTLSLNIGDVATLSTVDTVNKHETIEYGSITFYRSTVNQINEMISVTARKQVIAHTAVRIQATNSLQMLNVTTTTSITFIIISASPPRQARHYQPNSHYRYRCHSYVAT